MPVTERGPSLSDPICSWPLADMEVVIEGSEMPISVVKFATGSSDLLALADEGGQVRLIQLGTEAQVIQVLFSLCGVCCA